jgi:putative ABC transport system ATP-binding protein
MTALYNLKGITKDFDSGSVKFKALRGINLDIEEGEIVALCGPSGSGKSTLLNVLGLIEEPTSGQLAFAGNDLTTANESLLTRVRRGAVGFIFQNFNLIPVLTALENVEYALYLDSSLSKKEIRERSLAALKALGIEEWKDNTPAQLSGGQRQRVAIARAIVKKPHVVVADEPTANLDSKTANQIMDVIRDLNSAWGTTVIIATHDPVIAKTCDKIINIHDGKVKSIK